MKIHITTYPMEQLVGWSILNDDGTFRHICTKLERSGDAAREAAQKYLETIGANLASLEFKSVGTRSGVVQYFINGKRVSEEMAGYLRSAATRHECLHHGWARSGAPTFSCAIRIERGLVPSRFLEQES